MRPDAHGRPRTVATGLHSSVKNSFRPEACTGDPTMLSIVIANRGCGDVADLWISERRKNGFQVTFFGLVIAVGLDHEVVIFIAPVIVEIGQVALLALHPPRKIQVVIFRDSLA